MTRRSITINFDIHPQDITGLSSLRSRLIEAAGGDHQKVDAYFRQRFLATFAKFGSAYVKDMSARIDRIFALREKLAGGLEHILTANEAMHIDTFKKMFDDMSRELDELHSPSKALEKLDPTTLVDDSPPPVTAPAGSGRPPRPPDGGGPSTTQLEQAATTPRPREGLEIVREQTAIADLEADINRVAQTHPPEVVTRILLGIATFLDTDDTEALQGISHFLKQGGDPRVLARLVSARETSRTVHNLHDLVPKALAELNGLSQEAVRGIAVYIRLSHRISATHVLRILVNVQSKLLLNEIFRSVVELESRSRGLKNLIGNLARDDVFGPELVKAAQAHILTAQRLLNDPEFPAGAILVFEEALIFEVRDPTSGEVFTVRRRPDIRIELPSYGSVRTTIEVKFWTEFDSLQAEQRKQLANDMALDARNRDTYLGPNGGTFEVFATARWSIEYRNLAKQAANDLRRENPDIDIIDANTDARVEMRVREELTKRFEAVFSENEALLRAALGHEYDAYRQAVLKLVFVDFLT